MVTRTRLSVTLYVYVLSCQYQAKEDSALTGTKIETRLFGVCENNLKFFSFRSSRRGAGQIPHRGHEPQHINIRFFGAYIAASIEAIWSAGSPVV
jgi:hypothetical protein